MSSREAIQALTARSGAGVVVIPTLLYENGAWRGRAEIQDAATGTNAAVYNTDPIASSLAKDTAYALTAGLAREIEQHFVEYGPGVAYTPRAASARPRTLDAARAFEEGLNAYDELEYSSARAAFARAVDQDSRNPLMLAWLSRVAQVFRERDAASDAAERASGLVTEVTPRGDALFVAAVLAEARRDAPAAEARYRDLVDAFPDEPSYVMELGAFQDRQGQNTGAITTLQRALTLDAGLARADLDLCRMYNRRERPGPREAARPRRPGEVYEARGSWRGRSDAVLPDRRAACRRLRREGGGQAERRSGAHHLPGSSSTPTTWRARTTTWPSSPVDKETGWRPRRMARRHWWRPATRATSSCSRWCS